MSSMRATPSRSFAGGTLTAVGAISLSIGLKPAQIVLVVLPVDVSRVCVLNQSMPLIHRQASHRNTRDGLPATGAAKKEGAGITRIAQHAQRLTQLELAPNHFPFGRVD